MANLVAIVYNGIGITLEAASTWERRSTRLADMHASHSGITETVRHGYWDEVEVTIDSFSSRTVYNQLTAWWAWASRGKQYSIQLDDARSCITTLVNNEAIAATAIEVVSGAAVTAGKEYLIQASNLINREIVNVTVNGGGGALTISPGLKYAYTAGDLFRDPDYYAKAIALDNEFPCVENPGSTFTFAHRFREDRG